MKDLNKMLTPVDESTPAVASCVRDSSGRVLSANERCMELCNIPVGEVCDVGCNLHHRIGQDENRKRTVVLTGRAIHDRSFDLVVREEEGQILTLLFENQPSEAQKVERSELAQALTPQEKKVMECVERGYANREIARILGVKLSTVKTHINRIYSKAKSLRTPAGRFKHIERQD